MGHKKNRLTKSDFFELILTPNLTLTTSLTQVNGKRLRKNSTFLVLFELDLLTMYKYLLIKSQELSVKK
jgi:hypothetical protein